MTYPYLLVPVATLRLRYQNFKAKYFKGQIWELEASRPQVFKVFRKLAWSSTTILQKFNILMISEISHENSGRPKRVHTETTETEILVRFTETKPKLPKQNSAYIPYSNTYFQNLPSLKYFVAFFWPKKILPYNLLDWGIFFLNMVKSSVLVFLDLTEPKRTENIEILNFS